MAIVTRHLIEEHEYFKENRIRFVQVNNLPPGNQSEFTTIGNIYDVLTVAFSKIKSQKKKYDLKFIRPSDEELEDYKIWTDDFFRSLSKNFPPLIEYFEGNNDAEVLAKYRNPSGGHILFRPVGLLLIAELIGELIKQKVQLKDALQKVGLLPTDLSESPYVNVIWSPSLGRMESRASERGLCRRLLLYMLGYEKSPRDLRIKYAKQLDLEPDDCKLPGVLG